MPRISSESSFVSRITSSENIPVVNITVPLEEDIFKSSQEPAMAQGSAVVAAEAVAGSRVEQERTESRAGLGRGGARVANSTRRVRAAGETFQGPYVPRPYLFKMAGGAAVSGQHVRSPPQWLLMDHTLAVVWSLFARNKELPLGMVELHWALAFLRSVLRGVGDGIGGGGSGGGANDVRMCVQVIEERLLQLYADMGAVEGDAEAGAACSGAGVEAGVGLRCEGCPCRRSPTRPAMPSRTPSLRQPLSPIEEETSKHVLGNAKGLFLSRAAAAAGAEAEKEAAKTTAELDLMGAPLSATMESVMRSHSCSVYQLFKAGSAAMQPQSEEALPATAAPTASLSTLNASTPIAEPAPALASNTPAAAAVTTATAAIAAGRRTRSPLPSVKPISASFVSTAEDQPLNGDGSKDDMLNFLRQWRHDQVTRIDNEMEKLRSIEALLFPSFDLLKNT